jgi:uncharacterized protein YcbX
MQLAAINLYPIKSARGISLSAGQLDDFGLTRDRRWMVVDPAGRFVSQRESHRMALVEVALDGSELVLGGAGQRELRVSIPAAATASEPVTIWDDQCLAQDGGIEAAAWFSRFLGTPVRLMYMPGATFRTVNPNYVPEKRRVSFADAYPVLLATEGSLEDLNRRMEKPLPMNRFRPNLVVRGSDPFAEDQWKTIAVGEVTFDVVKPCDRCVTTTIDQSTGEAGKEPLRTLAQFRKWNGQVYFGQNLVHRSPGTLRVGDPVSLLS